MKEEDIIKGFGNNNPFRVPEGYFQRFTEQLMEQLPNLEVESKGETSEDVKVVTMWQRVKPLLYMAAMFIGMMFIAQHVLKMTYETEEVATEKYFSSLDVSISDEEMDRLIEVHDIMDDYTIYRYITEAE